MEVENVEIRNYEENVLDITINYPLNNKINTIEIDMCCVRATDSIRISYDHKRNGWSIKQAKPYAIKSNETVYDIKDEWFEVAYIESWSLYPCKGFDLPNLLDNLINNPAE